RRGAQRRRERQSLGGLAFHGILDEHEPARASRHRSLDHQHTAFGIGRDHLEALGGDPLGPKMSRHFLVLKGLARRLTLTGRAVAPMRYRNAVTGTQTAEIVPLHRASEALADAET